MNKMCAASFVALCLTCSVTAVLVAKKHIEIPVLQQVKEPAKEPEKIEVVPTPPAEKPYPFHFPQFHSNKSFWHGYDDGLTGKSAEQYRQMDYNNINDHQYGIPRPPNSKAYNAGYEVGRYDRANKNTHYRDQYKK